MNIRTENGMVYNDDGLVAMRKFPQIPQLIQIHGGSYYFDVQRNIALAWVKPEHVGTILAITKTCCGGSQSHPFRLASESDARIWLGISER